MTTKKYILTFVIFFVLLAASPVLFFVGLLLKGNNSNVFYMFVAFACISLISAIVFYVSNYKKLIAYDTDRIRNKVKNLDFSVFEASVNESELYEKLKNYGYVKTAERLFHKRVEDNVGDGAVVSHYYVAAFQSNSAIDISRCVEKFNKGMTTYNIGYIFICENVEGNLEILKNYIKETVVDVETHRYGYKKFFVPIIISAEKIYYLKAGSFISEYKYGAIEGLRILGCNDL